MLRCLSTMVLSFCFIFFCHHFDLILYFFSSYLLGVFSFLLLCISPSFRGGELLSVLPFPKFSYCISGIIKFALLCWGVGGEGKEPEGEGRSRRDTELLF